MAKQVGAGNAPLGGIVADGPIMVRGNGVPVKIVAVFGGKGFMQLVVREDSGIEKPADLKGKTITVMSFQDTTFYALLGLLASVGLTQNDVNIQSVGPDRRVGIRRHRQVRRHGRRAGLDPAGAGRGREGEGDPDRRVLPAHGAGHRRLRSSHQGQAGDGAQVRQAALRGMKDMMDDPDKAADDFVRFVPEWKGKEGGVKFAFNMYAKLVYPGQKELGEVNADRLAKLQDFYVAKGFIQKATPVDELYTNAFIK